MAVNIVHVEIAGRDGGVLEKFYKELFHWDIRRENAGGCPYGKFDFKDLQGLTGGIRHEPEGEAEIVVYVQVDDLKKYVSLAEALGGSIRIPPMRAGDLYFALISDPENNPIGIIEGDQ
ncbi:MAG: hypothetical protein MJA83_14940 [Gammaproteobacteria bacterium]|nr:hypothetical protein [Gammaproteobacteria bacterium]